MRFHFRQDAFLLTACDRYSEGKSPYFVYTNMRIEQVIVLPIHFVRGMHRRDVHLAHIYQ